MGKDKKVVVDYFTASHDLDPLFHSLSEEAQFADKQVPDYGDYVRIHELTFRSTEGVWLGVVGRIRVDSSPGKASLSQEVTEDLLLQEDEGVAEKTVFIYDPTTRWLLYQFNSLGLRIQGFTRYLNRLKLPSKPDEIEFWPIFNPKAGVDRLLKSQRLTRLQFRLSIPQARENLKLHEADLPSDALLDFADYFETPNVEVIVRRAKGARDGSLPISRATKWMQSLVGLQDVVERASASIAESDEDRVHPVDLLHDRLRFTKETSFPRLQSQTIEMVKDVVLQAFQTDRARVFEGAG